ncbi:hypothetical protein AKJ16_DCAP25266 [Drosera capensis]
MCIFMFIPYSLPILRGEDFKSRLNFMGNIIIVKLSLLKEFYASLDSVDYPADTEDYNTWCENACLVHLEFQRIFYSPGARSFIRFCLNVSIDVTGELQDSMPRSMATLLLSVWPDFPFDIHRLMSREPHWQAALPIVSYLKGTPSTGILLSSTSPL